MTKNQQDLKESICDSFDLFKLVETAIQLANDFMAKPPKMNDFPSKIERLLV